MTGQRIPRTSLVGRARDAAAVGALVLDPAVPLVSLTGPGGVGKTRLALSVVAAVGPAFADGACFVDFSPLRDPAFVVPAIAAAFGLVATGPVTPLDQIATHLRHRQLLLVLDNVEHVIAAAPAIADLLELCPGLRVLATSRVVLRISGEHDYPVAPLPCRTPCSCLPSGPGRSRPRSR